VSTAVDQFALLTREQLAQRLGLSVDGLNKFVAQKRIPVIKLGWRTHRFSWPAVERALAKMTIAEVQR
jgi:excisionase family DNA binding protein